MPKPTDLWFPLYITDYLRDTMRLTHAQHGSYLLILMDYWINGAPPDDDAVLATIAKASHSDWPAIRSAISHFFQVRDGHWYQKRAELEKAKAKNLQESKSAAGKIGNARRWGDRRTIAGGIANGSQTVSQEASQNDPPSPSPSPSPSESPTPSQKPTGQHAEKHVGQTRRKACRLDPSWKPSEAGIAFATKRGLDPA